jgi:hypothetical protein
MLSDILNTKNSGTGGSDAFAEFLQSILGNNDASITIKINAASSKNKRDVHGDMQSTDMMEVYPERTTQLLRELGMFAGPTADSVFNGFGAQPNNPYSMESDVLKNLLSQQATPTIPPNASQDIPPELIAQLLGGGQPAPAPAGPEQGLPVDPVMVAMGGAQAPMAAGMQDPMAAAGGAIDPALLQQLMASIGR